MQIERASLRDDIESSEIVKIIQNQASRITRLNAADDIIYNDRDLNYLKEQVNQLHKNYMEIASDTITSST